MDPELADLIEQLTAGGYLTEATSVSTVAQKVAVGRASLSAAELQTFDQEVVPALHARAQKQEEDEQRAQSEDE